MKNIEEIDELFIDAKTANYQFLDYLKKCRRSLLFVSAANYFKNIVDTNLLKEATLNTKRYIEELKEDRFNLRIIEKTIIKVSSVGVRELEDEFAYIIKCIENKACTLGNAEEYYINKIKSQVMNYEYLSPKVDDRLDEYNNYMNTLILKLRGDTLDKDK